MTRLLAIESSCDETSASVLKCDEKIEVLSDIIASQIEKHTLFGGVVPEVASRMHIECISRVVDDALKEAGVTFSDIDAIAVTYAPGLIGALLVGVNYAKSLALALKKPLIAVHHIEGHISANYIAHSDLKPPFVCLVASGGHSTIALAEDYDRYRVIAKTRDDAAGEAFDKIARVLGLGYPGGPKIQKTAELGNENAYTFPKVTFSENLDFSFSGVKTNVINMIHKMNQKNEEIPVNDIAASFQYNVCDVLASRLVMAAKQEGVKNICLAGGVAANTKLRSLAEKYAKENGLNLYYPPLVLCTDNAAMIGARGYFDYKKKKFVQSDLNAVATKNM